MVAMPAVRVGDPLFGLDPHDAVVPITGKVPAMPHVVCGQVGGDGAHEGAKVFVNGQPIVLRDHENQGDLVHVPAGLNVLAPLLLVASSGKLPLGASRVLVGDKPVAAGPSPVLACADPVSTVHGLTIPWTNVFVDVSPVDVLRAALVPTVAYLQGVMVDKVVARIGPAARALLLRHLPAWNLVETLAASHTRQARELGDVLVPRVAWALRDGAREALAAGMGARAAAAAVEVLEDAARDPTLRAVAAEVLADARADVETAVTEPVTSALGCTEQDAVAALDALVGT